MKSKSKIICCIFLIAIVIFSTVCFATDAQNDVVTNGTTDTAVNGETTSDLVKEDVYLIQDDILVEGMIDGNVYAIGKNVTVTAQIGGDLFVMAESLKIDEAYIYNSVYALAEDISIKGLVYDIYSISNNFTLQEESYIYRDIKIMAENVNINGKVGRNAFVSAGNITFSEVSDTYILGNLEYSSKNEISIAENAVLGNINYNKIEEEPTNLVKTYVLDIVTLLLNTLVILLLAIWITPKFVQKVANMGIKKSLISIVIGLGALIIIPVIVVLMLTTVVAMPISLCLFAIYMLLLVFSTSIASIVIGSYAAKKLKLEGKLKLVITSLIVTIVLYMVSLIPYVGGVVSFLSVLLGFGTVIYNLFTKVPEEVTEQ